MLEKGTLYVCATPIGNLGDITLRVLDTLREVDLIAAEDTRHSRKLLEHYQIKTPLTSYHEHNEKGKTQALLRRLKEGDSIALISDAGMPGISDPGAEIMRACLEDEVKVDVLPGPNAALTALLLSGLPAEPFVFHGFLPAAGGDRRRRLENLAKLPFTQVFYEAPHRLTEVLQDMSAILGARQAAVVREITKLHQSVHRGLLPALEEEFSLQPAKGECCLVIAPYSEEKEQGSSEDWVREVHVRLALGVPPQEAMKEVAKVFGVAKREVYQAVLKYRE